MCNSEDIWIPQYRELGNGGSSTKYQQQILTARRIPEPLIATIISKYGIQIKFTEVEAGSGSLPLEKIPSVAIVFNDNIKVSHLSNKFRTSSYPVLGYVSGNRFHIDLKAIPHDQFENLVTALLHTLE